MSRKRNLRKGRKNCRRVGRKLKKLVKNLIIYLTIRFNLLFIIQLVTGKIGFNLIRDNSIVP